MSFDVFLLDKAEDDIASHFGFLSKTNTKKALSFHKAVFDSFDQLCINPMIGSPVKVDDQRLLDMRMWFVKGFEKYLIFYRPYGNYIEVVRILHSAQDRGTILIDE